MKKITLILILLIACCLGSAQAATYSNQGRYVVRVRPILSVNPTVLGPELSASTPLQTGQGYQVSVQALSFEAPNQYAPAIFIENAVGFEVGCYCWPNYTFSPFTPSNQAGGDTGPAQNHTITFTIRATSSYAFMSIYSYSEYNSSTGTYDEVNEDLVIFP